MARDIIIVVCLFIGSMAGAQNCTREQLNTDCGMGDLLVLGKQVYPTNGTTAVQDACSAWQTSEECVTTMSELCEQTAQELRESYGEGEISETQYLEMKDIRGVYQTAQEYMLGYEYLCQEDTAGRDEFQMCHMTNQTELEAQADICYSEYKEKTWWINARISINVYKYCTATLEFLDCVEASVLTVCGSQTAADWAKKFHNQLWKTHMVDTDCESEGGFGPGSIAIVTICTFGAAMSVLLVGVSFAVKSKVPEDTMSPDGRRQSMADIRRKSSAGADLPAAPEHGILKRRTTNGTASVA